ncbi:MAG: hypothetical protein ACLSVD_16480, partial [Eggerthellaceae bacterium]
MTGAAPSKSTGRMLNGRRALSLRAQPQSFQVFRSVRAQNQASESRRGIGAFVVERADVGGQRDPFGMIALHRAHDVGVLFVDDELDDGMGVRLENGLQIRFDAEGGIHDRADEVDAGGQRHGVAAHV